MKIKENKFRKIVRNEVNKVLSEASQGNEEEFKKKTDELVQKSGVPATQLGPGRWRIDDRYYVQAKGMTTVLYDDQKWEIGRINDQGIVPHVIWGLVNYK